MGLAEPSAPASLAQTAKMCDTDDFSSPLPVSVAPGGSAFSPARETQKVLADVDNAADADEINWRGRDLPSVGQDLLAAAAATASAKISETAHRAAELTLGAVAPGTTTEDLVRASKEGLWSALSAVRTLAAGAVEGTRRQYHAVASAVEAAREVANASNSSSSSAALLGSFSPEDGSTVFAAFTASLRDEVVSSSSSAALFPPASRRIRGSLLVTSTSLQFLVSRAHQALGRAVSRAVAASAAEPSAALLGSAAGSELGGFLGATLAAEDAGKDAREAEAAAGLPAAGSVAVIPLGEIEKVRIVVGEEGSSSSSNPGGGGQNALVFSVKGGREGGGKEKSVTFSSFGAPSDADEALALVEHLMGEGKE